MGTVAVYCRISKDPEGRREGVRVQERRATSYAADHWPDLPVVVYVDNDLTAAKQDVVRPQFEAMLTAVRRGQHDQVVCAEQSRLVRLGPAEWERICVILAKAGIHKVHCYRGPSPDITGSRLVGRILAAVDAEEVERLRARILDRLDAMASEGRPAGAQSYAHRYIDGTLTVDPDKARIVNEVADKILAGWSLTAVARHLERTGVPTRRGGSRWTATAVRGMVTAPTVAGIRVRRGENIGAGGWEAALEPDRWRAVCAVLDAPIRFDHPAGFVYTRPRKGRVSPRRYLLTGGVARCGLCGAGLSAQQHTRRNATRQAMYLCHPKNGGCSKIGIIAEPFEDDVARRLFARVDEPGFWAVYADDGTARRQTSDGLAAVGARQTDLAARWAVGEVTGPEWDTARRVLDSEQRRLQSVLASLPPPLCVVDPSRLAGDWPGMTLDERRATVGRYVLSVTVLPATVGARQYDPGRVKIKFRVPLTPEDGSDARAGGGKTGS